MQSDPLLTAVWYHGSDQRFEILRAGSTVTRWRPLADKPSLLEITDEGSLLHNGTAPGFLYALDEAVCVGCDVVPHPRTTMEPGLEFLTTRPLRMRGIARLP